MRSGWLTHVMKLRVTACYALALAGVTIVMGHLTARVQDEVIRHTSTNLHNLGHGRIGTLVGSAFVVDAGPLYLWLPGLVCLLAAAELAWGSQPLVIAAGAGHIGATVIVAFGLAVAVKTGWIGPSIAHAPDVGMSYVAMAALGMLTGVLPPRWRAAWAGWWLGAALVVIAAGPDFTDIGHVLALSLGMAVSLRSGAPRRCSLPVAALMAVGAGFAYLVLVADTESMTYGAAWGALGAMVCQGFARLRDTVPTEVLASRGGPPWQNAPQRIP